MSPGAWHTIWFPVLSVAIKENIKTCCHCFQCHLLCDMERMGGSTQWMRACLAHTRSYTRPESREREGGGTLEKMVVTGQMRNTESGLPLPHILNLRKSLPALYCPHALQSSRLCLGTPLLLPLRLLSSKLTPRFGTNSNLLQPGQNHSTS